MSLSSPCNSAIKAVLLIGFIPLQAQAVVYDSGVLKFNYNGSNMWGSDSSFVMSMPDQFVGINIGPQEFKLGGVQDTDVGSYGVEADVRIGYNNAFSRYYNDPKRVGLNLGLNIDSGHVNVNYNVDARLNLPDAPVVNGSLVSFGMANNTSVSNSSLHTQLGTASVYEDFVYDIPASVNLKGCLYDCAQTSFITEGHIDPFELFSINRNNDGLIRVYNIVQDVNFNKPFDVDVKVVVDGVELSNNLGSVTAYVPNLQTNTNVLDTKGQLTTSGTTKLIDASINLSNAVSLMSGFGATNVKVNLDDAASISINPVSLNLQPSLSLEQKFTFDPNLKVELKFDQPVTADINSFFGKHSQTTNDFVISMSDMANYQFKFNQDTHVIPTFSLGNSFHNQSQLDVSLGIQLAELQTTLSIPGQDFTFPGFSQNLYDTDIQKFTVFDEAYSLNFKSFKGNEFVVRTLVQSADGNYVVWTGQGADNNWTTTGNWQGGVKPVAGDALLFNGSQGGRVTATDNNSGLNINGITFLDGASSFVIDGSAAAKNLSNSGDIINQSGKIQDIKQTLLVTDNQQWDGGSGGLIYEGNLAVDNDLRLSLLNTQVKSDNSITVGGIKSGTLDLSSNSQLQVIDLAIGGANKSIGKVAASGADVQITLDKQLMAGNAGNSYFYLDTGSKASASSAVFGNHDTANSYVNLAGFGTQLSVKNQVILGNEGLSLFKISNGASLNTGAVEFAVNKSSGSELQMSDSGTNWLVNGSMKSGGDGETKLLVDNRSQLTVYQDLIWGTAAGRSALTINNGGQVAINGNATIGGNGSVYLGTSSADTAELQVAKVTTVASDGMLNLLGAKASLVGGLNVAGTVNSNNTSIIEGNITLASGVGQIINKSGQLTLLGDVIHNGDMLTTNAGATTIFDGAVSGAGSFNGGGTLDFEKSYAPGNSPAAVQFGGDNVTFGTSSTLAMDIFGSALGQNYDQMLTLNNFNFGGHLQLNFGSYVPDVAMVFNLFNFKTFTGELDDANIFVSGFDKSRLDFSQLALTGQFSVKAVPLPPSFVFLLSGLAGLAASSAKRKRLV